MLTKKKRVVARVKKNQKTFELSQGAVFFHPMMLIAHKSSCSTSPEDRMRTRVGFSMNQYASEMSE
jgi:hypothetical protein